MDKIYCNNIPDKQNCQLLYGKNSKLSAADGIEGCPRANRECFRGCMFAQGAGIWLKRSGAGKQEGLLGGRVRPKEPLAARNSPRGRTKGASESACSPREREFSRKEAERANKRVCWGFVFARRNRWQPGTFLAGEQRVIQRMHVRPASRALPAHRLRAV